MFKFYSNENFPYPTVLHLRKLGYDVKTSQDAGNAGLSISDDEVLSYAIKETRAIITLNRRHFIQLHRNHINHFGIVVCKFDPDFIHLANHIHEILSKMDSINGQLIRINRDVKKL